MSKHVQFLIALAIVVAMPLFMKSGSLASEVLIYGLAAMGCNLLLGYTAYALPTAIVKGLCAVVAALGMRRKSAWTRAGALILAEIVMAAGYFVFEWLVLGAGAAGALANVPGNLIQGASGVVIACALLPVLKKAKLTV